MDEDSARRVIKIPISDGQWIDVGLASIMAALTTHPDTKVLALAFTLTLLNPA